MRFLADENFPYPSVAVLRDAGVDVLSIQEASPSIADTAVIELAMQLNRTILTFDRDYGELVYRYNYRPAEGIIYFRWETYEPKMPGEFIIRLLLDTELNLRNTFLVVMPNGQLRSSSY